MFEWKVEDMALLNQKGGVFIGKEYRRILTRLWIKFLDELIVLCLF